MKKIALLSLLFVIALAVAACGGDKATDTPVPTEPLPTVAMADTPEPAAVAGSDIVNIVWQWADLVETMPAAQSVVPATENYTIVFNSDGTVSIQADCNVVSGGYTLEGNALSIQPGPSTMAFCGEQSSDQQYLGLLGSVGSVSLENGRLMLHLRDDAGRMGFNNAGPQGAVDGPPVGGLTPETLANMTYQSDWTQSGTATLQNGQYSEAVAPGSATQTKVMLTEYLAFGELDGQIGAAAILVTDPGGSGTFYELAVVVERDGQPVHVASAPLGDRAQINSLTIQSNGIIVVDMITHGPEDPMCCPTQQVVRGWALQRDRLIGGGVGINPGSVNLDTQDLPYSYQAVAVPASAYDESMPPGPVGMPEHIEILFGVTNPADRQPLDPVMYIIPAAAYGEQWTLNDNTTVADRMKAIFQMVVALPYPAPTSGMSVLPMEMVMGRNDMATQVGRVGITDASASKNGFRFVGRFAQDANPVTSDGLPLQYIYQGFTNDGQYLVAFFYPVTSSSLPSNADVAEAFQQAAGQPDGAQAYIESQAVELNGLATADWQPDLAALDALVASLEIVGMPGNGVEGQAWVLSGESTTGGADPEPLANAQDHTLTFLSDGTLNWSSDCNQGQGTYSVSGGAVGGIAMDLGIMTLAECGPNSYQDKLVNTLVAAQDYRVHPGGFTLELVRPASGGSLFFDHVGPADAPPPDVTEPPVELPTPAPQGPYGRVSSADGVNLRTGPGTIYPVVGFAPDGAEGQIVGKSADGQWWVVPVAASPSGLGWAAAAYVEAFNVQNVPVIAAPPAPIPTPTPTPVATPSPSIDFWADSTSISQNECTTLRWKVENVQAVWMYPQGQPYQGYPVTGEGSREECPASTTTYELRVQRPDGAVELRQITVQVSIVNALAGTNWELSSMNVNQLPIPGTFVSVYFSPNGTLRGAGSCNTYTGSYTVNGSNLSIGSMMPTMKSCSADVDAQEQAYFTALQSAATFELTGNQLVIRDAGSQEVLRYNRAY
jgi:heat shock protein HslJ/uncharacterized protein YraI